MVGFDIRMGTAKVVFNVFSTRVGNWGGDTAGGCVSGFGEVVVGL